MIRHLQGHKRRKVFVTIIAISIVGTVAVSQFHEVAVATWRRRAREESIRVLSSIASRQDAMNAIGNGGVFLSLTNGSWIVIRVVVEYEPDREVAMACDSDGKFFGTNRRFSGGLSWYPRFKATPKKGIVDANMQCIILEGLEGSSNLTAARQILEGDLGFVPLNPKP